MENVRRANRYKVKTPMKQLLVILCLAPMVFSCTKEVATEAPKPKMMITVEVTSQDPSFVTIPAVGSESFQGSYKKTFPAPGHVVSVNIHSDEPSLKTITIYVNGEVVAQRSGTCEVTDYNLTYDLNQF